MRSPDEVALGRPVARTMLFARSMKPLGRRLIGGLAGLCVLAWSGSIAAAPPANPRALAVKRFEDRVNAYLELRRRVEAKMAPLQKTAEPATIAARQKALGEAIREARPDARQGDLFTPDVAALIREVIRADFERRSHTDARAVAQSIPDVRLRVNDAYPTGVPLATTPPRLLAQLPRLPDGLEYRLVGDSLILRDADPNLVVDFLPRAVPRPPATP